MPIPTQCPCGSGLPYEMCCGMYHHNPGTAPTAQALMRSRYSAFAIKDFNYISETHLPDDQPTQNAEHIADCNDHTQWIRLEILDTVAGEEKDKEGVVEFVAHFKEGKHIGRLKERSVFRKVNGRWYYVAGEHEIQGNTPLLKSAEMKIGRNDPCLCGSGKKYKKCCG